MLYKLDSTRNNSTDSGTVVEIEKHDFAFDEASARAKQKNRDVISCTSTSASSLGKKEREEDYNAKSDALVNRSVNVSFLGMQSNDKLPLLYQSADFFLSCAVSEIMKFAPHNYLLNFPTSLPLPCVRQRQRHTHNIQVNWNAGR